MVSCIHGDDGKPVKIAITFGLVALAVFASLLIVVGIRVAPRVEAGLGLQPKQQYVPGGVSYDDGKTAPLNQMPINEDAAREKKRGPQVAGNQPAPAPAAPQSVNLTSTPTTPRYSVSLFVGPDAKSQQFLDWFNRDPSLQELKKQTNFQAYTKDNPLYRERYSKLIQPIDFPGVIVSDPSGGHVYAASGYHAPTSAAILYREIYDAFQVHQKVVQPADPSPVNSESFSLASSSSQPDCPDGNCLPADRQPFLNPDREGLFPNLRPRPANPVESLLTWILFPENALLFLLCFLTTVCILFVIAVKVLRS